MKNNYLKIALLIISLYCHLKEFACKKYQQTSELEQVIDGYLPLDVGNEDRVVFFNKIDKLAQRFHIYEFINPQVSYEK